MNRPVFFRKTSPPLTTRQLIGYLQGKLSEDERQKVDELIKLHPHYSRILDGLRITYEQHGNETEDVIFKSSLRMIQRIKEQHELKNTKNPSILKYASPPAMFFFDPNVQQLTTAVLITNVKMRLSFMILMTLVYNFLFVNSLIIDALSTDIKRLRILLSSVLIVKKLIVVENLFNLLGFFLRQIEFVLKLPHDVYTSTSLENCVNRIYHPKIQERH